MTPRHLYHDVLDWLHERGGKYVVVALGVLLVALWCIGIVWAGETELIEGDSVPVYTHQIAATSPTVAATVTDPTVEHPSAPVGSVATTCEETP